MDEDRDIEREESAIYWIVMLVCAPIIISYAIRGGYIDGGTTIILILVALGLVGVFAGLRTQRKSRR